MTVKLRHQCRNNGVDRVRKVQGAECHDVWSWQGAAARVEGRTTHRHQIYTLSTIQSISRFLRWIKWCNNCKDHEPDDTIRYEMLF